MCRKPIQTVEVPEIANFGIEMDQLHLCLCSNCGQKYENMKSRNKEEFRNEIIEDILDIYVDFEYDEDEEYELVLNNNDSLWFNQTHLAEIQEILKLLGRYGTPNEEKITG